MVRRLTILFMNKMKNYAITSGKFTGNGNFTGYNSVGERVHIHKAQMNSAGWKEDKDLAGKFPFYAIGTVKQIGQLDENQQPKKNADGSPVLVDRLTATSIYTSKQALIDAQVDNLTLDLEVAKGVKEAGAKAGLTEKDLQSLVVF